MPTATLAPTFSETAPAKRSMGTMQQATMPNAMPTLRSAEGPCAGGMYDIVS